MAKILNLDKLKAKPPAERRVLQIDGVEHPIVEMTVEMFIDTQLAAEKIKDEPSMLAHINASIDAILRFVPSVKREQLTGYTLDVLGSIVGFVRGDDVEAEQAQEGAQLAAAAAGEGEAGK